MRGRMRWWRRRGSGAEGNSLLGTPPFHPRVSISNAFTRRATGIASKPDSSRCAASFFPRLSNRRPSVRLISHRSPSASWPEQSELASGTLVGAVTVIVVNARRGAADTISVTAGGFDAVAIPAVTGDTLDFTITGVNGISSAKSVVPAHQPPRVVRTSPVRGRTDVAINASVAVMFSEPIAPATLDTATIHLISGSASVTGTVRLIGAPAIGAEFVPDAPLAGSSTYHLLLGSQIVDLSGEAIDGPTDVSFTTIAGDSSTAPDGSAIRLTFWTQPSSQVAGLDVWPAVQVIARNAAGDQVFDWSGPVTLSLAANPAGATLSGQVSVSFVGGIATFAGATISASGSGFTLQASSPGATSATSAAFSAFASGCCGTPAALFSMIEYRDSISGIWQYAPLVTLTETSGQGAVIVPELEFTIPGVAPTRGFTIPGAGASGGAPACFNNLQVLAGESVEVFQEIYGDYSVTFGQSGDRATSGNCDDARPLSRHRWSRGLA